MKKISIEATHDVKDKEVTEEDDDDDEGFISYGNTGIPKFEVELDETIQSTCKTIVFAEGKQAIEFAKSCLSMDRFSSLGKVLKTKLSNESDFELWGLHYKPSEPSLIYKVNNETLLCTFSFDLFPEDFNQLARSIICSFNKSHLNVIILTVSAISSFKSECFSNTMETTVIRTLSTVNSSENKKIPQLEQPNILGGLTAGILSACELKEIKATACVVFSPSLNLDKDIMDGFTTFLNSTSATSHLEIKPIKKFSIDIGCGKTGNLYI